MVSEEELWGGCFFRRISLFFALALVNELFLNKPLVQLYSELELKLFYEL
jgi:hypothetical protein